MSLELLFQELDSFIKSHELEKSLSVCEKILKLQPNDKDAFHCKVVSYIQLHKFQDALDLLESNGTLAADLIFEKAYCLYAQRAFDKVLKLLEPLSTKPARILHLLAQTYYRLEQFDKSINVYQEIQDKHKDQSPELKSNLAAAFNSAKKATEALKLASKSKADVESTHEFAYNVACAAITNKDYLSAKDYLLQAIEIAKAQAKEENLEEKLLLDELAVLNTQLAYVLQLTGETSKALDLYNSVIKIKPSDAAVLAVASNNVIALRKDESNLFDAEKKLKAGTSEAAEIKLANWQKRAINFNRCLLLLKMKRPDQCKELSASLGFDEDEPLLALIHGSILYKENKVAECLKLLQSFVDKYPSKALAVQLSMAQIHHLQGAEEEVLQRLRQLEELRHRPSWVATVVSLLERCQRVEDASAVFDEAVAFWSSEKSKIREDELGREKELAALLMARSVDFKLKYKKYKEAAEVAEKLVAQTPNNTAALANLVIALSQFNPKAAETYAARIPTINQENVDARALENSSTQKIRSQSKQNPEVGPTKTLTKKKAKTPEQKKKEREKRRLKKIKKMKTYDPKKKPDPERWLPKRERQSFKKGKKKGGPSRASQGAASTSSKGLDKSKQQQQQQSKKGKKGKK